MQAMEQVGSKATLTLVGRRTAACPPLDPWLTIHRWIPTLSHDEILSEMRNHDVLAFPSLFEGFGLVILEALSCGLPVIATPNSAGPDLLTAGEDGFIVPIRSAEALAGKIELLADDRQLLGEMSRRALEKAAHFTWQRYAAQILPLLCCRTFEMEAERHIL
jgi:glycosyltransferase involved in cell wall biosynthesis